VGRMPEGKPRALRFLTDRRSPTRATFFDRRSHTAFIRPEMEIEKS
jgi:hypothetical protein